MPQTVHRSTLLMGCVLFLLAGCASPPPPRMEVLVTTTPPGAACLLSRLGQPIATTAPTPAIALVEPSDAEITIFCRRNGFADAAVALMPQPAAPGFTPPFLAVPQTALSQRVDIALAPR